MAKTYYWRVDEFDVVDIAGAAIVAMLVVFSLSRGLCSVSAKDVLGKTVPKGRRGRLNGWAASLSGLFVLGVGVWFAIGKQQERNGDQN
mgnify:CR=1 FL=1